ncbi:Uncharacterised protein [Mycobacteroides abscessus subsp. abscessus]|nr:Uncharacterised protein [Mycobacteroides abscessus subsp. abscessus]
MLITDRCPSTNLGSAMGTSSRVTTSVKIDDSDSSSGRLQNFPTRVTGRSDVPVALNSTVLTVVVNAAPQSLMSATPAAARRSGRR